MFVSPSPIVPVLNPATGRANQYLYDTPQNLYGDFTPSPCSITALTPLQQVKVNMSNYT